ncbi:MAG: hypothetical protein WC340_10470 [Kiritimatiellia bacterium]
MNMPNNAHIPGSEQIPGSAGVPVGFVLSHADGDVGTPRTTNAAISTVYNNGEDAD